MNRRISTIRTLLLSVLLIVVFAACSPAATASRTDGAPAVAEVEATTTDPIAGLEPTDASSVEDVSVAADAPADASTKLNLNTASANDFLDIPGVGDRMVREFMEYRPYVSIEQFRREIGKYVSDEEVAAYEAYVFVPVSANDADAATLMQIQGLDESEAQALIDARPYASNEDFLAALGQYVSAEELAIATAYLSD